MYDPKNPGSLRNNYVGALMYDSGGDLWMGNREYLSRLKKGSGMFEHYNSNSRNLDDFDAININAICKDKDGLIWLGTGNGIKRFNPVYKKIQSLLL